MFPVREVMYCKPGKVRPLVEKFKAMGQLMAKHKLGNMRIFTDFSAEAYWTLVAEMEVESLDHFMDMNLGEADTKEFEAIMQGYHDLVDHGKREIYNIEL